MKYALFALFLPFAVALAVGPEVTPIPAPAREGYKDTPVAANELVVYGASPASEWEFVDDTFTGRVFESGAVAAFVFPPGRHRVVVTGPDKKKNRILFIAGNNPDPKPPEPPLPPSPPDALTKELATLYAGEPAATRKADMQSLSALYTLMVGEAGKADYATAAQLNATFLKARDQMLKGDTDAVPRLPSVRSRCGVEVAAVIGTDPDSALTDATRTKLKALYARLAQAVNDATK